MSGFSVRVDDHEVTAALRALQGRVKSLRRPLAEIGQTLVTLSDLSFRAQHDPWGAAWAQLSEVTLMNRARRRSGGKSLRTKKGNTRAAALRVMLTAQALIDTGILRNSINARAGADRVEVGTNLVYAATQQFGAKRGAFGYTLSGTHHKSDVFDRAAAASGLSMRGVPIPWGDIPARPFLPIRPDGTVDLPRDTLDDMLDILHRHLAGTRQ